MNIDELLVGGNDDNVIETHNHTLYIDEVKDDIEQKVAIIEDEEQIIATPIPPYTQYTLYISDFMNKSTDTHKIIHKLKQAKDGDKINIVISSDGGSVSEGVDLMNIIKETFTNITTTVNSSAYSMGMLMMTIGDERVIYQDSSVMAHNVSLGLGGSGNQVRDYLDHELKHFDRLFRTNVVSKGYMTEDEYEKMKIGKELWLSSRECTERGLATHIIVNGFKMDAEAYLEFSAQDKDVDSWVTDKMNDVIEEAMEDKPVLNKDGSVSKRWLKKHKND